MDKNHIASEIYGMINIFSDYIKSGFIEKHPKIEFNFDNHINDNNNSYELDSTVKKVELKKKPEFVDIREKRKKIIELSEKIMNCKNCALCKSSDKVSGAGNVNADVFIIADPPKEIDVSNSRPVTGDELSFLKKWLISIDIDLNDAFVTNIIKCNPKKQKITKEIIEKCRAHLDMQISLVETKVILTLGQLPASSLKRSHFDLSKNHGRIYQYNGYPVISTFSPQTVLKDQQLKNAVWHDLNILKNFLNKH